MNRLILRILLNILAVSLIVFTLAGCKSTASKAGKTAYIDSDYETALAEFEKAAAEGDGESQWWLAIMYAEGNGVPVNEAESVKWMKMSAESGYDRAQVDIGLKYLSGTGVEKNDAEALRWVQMAADQNSPIGLATLGVMYTQGLGVAADKAKAREYLQKAKDEGFSVPEEILAMTD